MNCKFCQKELPNTISYGDEIDMSFDCFDCKSSFLFDTDNQLIKYSIRDGDLDYRIVFHPKSNYCYIEHWDRVSIHHAYSAFNLVLKLNHCPDNITPANIHEKLKLNLLLS